MPRLAFAAVAGMTLLALGAPGCLPDTTLPASEPLAALYPEPTDGPVCSAADLTPEDPDAFVAHFIDVGQGDAIWLRLPSGDPDDPKEILIDAGLPGGGAGGGGGATVAAYLEQNGMPPGEIIDWLVVTHGDQDHYGGVPEVLASYRVGNYLGSGFIGGGNDWPVVLEAIAAAVADQGGRFVEPALGGLVARPGDVAPELSTAAAEVRVLWGTDQPPQPDPSNNAAVVLQVTVHGFTLLLTADIQGPTEEALVGLHDSGEIDLASQLLKVAHHGSTTSSSEAFLDRAFGGVAEGSRYAVIQSGTRSFGGVTLPRDEVVGRLRGRLQPGRLLSTQHEDAGEAHGAEFGDDHILLVVPSAEQLRLCYRVDGGIAAAVEPEDEDPDDPDERSDLDIDEP